MTVIVSKRAEKSLSRAPRQVVVNFVAWVKEVETHGIALARKTPGYHDEPLKGKLQGIRSIRLGLGYRAYYRGENILTVEEVNKHDYKAIERLLGK